MTWGCTRSTDWLSCQEVNIFLVGENINVDPIGINLKNKFNLSFIPTNLNLISWTPPLPWISWTPFRSSVPVEALGRPSTCPSNFETSCHQKQQRQFVHLLAGVTLSCTSKSISCKKTTVGSKWTGICRTTEWLATTFTSYKENQVVPNSEHQDIHGPLQATSLWPFFPKTPEIFISTHYFGGMDLRTDGTSISKRSLTLLIHQGMPVIYQL